MRVPRGFPAALMLEAASLTCKNNWKQLSRRELRLQVELVWGRNTKTVNKSKLLGTALQIVYSDEKGICHISAYISVLQKLRFHSRRFCLSIPTKCSIGQELPTFPWKSIEPKGPLGSRKAFIQVRVVWRTSGWQLVWTVSLHAYEDCQTVHAIMYFHLSNKKKRTVDTSKWN